MVDQFLGQVIAGKYLIEAFMRQTDLGPMFRGRHVIVDRPVTVKLLHPQLAADEAAVKTFEFEARAEARVVHPNVLNITDVGADGLGMHYVIYEPAAGTTLQTLMATAEHGLDVERAVRLVRHAADGLAAAHEQNLLHGRLSPLTILVDEASGDTVKVFDFASRVNTSNTGRDARYVAPEILDGAEGDTRSDVYSLGVILYELLAGRPPFDSPDETEIRRLHAEEPPPPLSAFGKDLPANLEAVILKALAMDPEMRHQSVIEFKNELEAIAGSRSAAAAATTAGKPDIWKTAFIVIVGISLLSAVLIYATYTKQTDPTTQLQPDANGQPVQPLNPATGSQEETLANLPPNAAEMLSNSNMALPPGTLPGGDGYNPWASGGTPPPGAPPQTYVSPGGQVITIDPNNPSQFMPTEGGIILVPIPANANTAKPTPTPKTPSANANAAPTPATPADRSAPKPSPTPAARQTPAPEGSPSKPAANKPDEEQ